MDGVSVASSVAGLVTLTLQVGGAVATYVTAIKERSKNVKELQDELLLLGEVLSNLRDFLNSEKAAGRSFDRYSVLSKAIRDCRQRIERIGDRLKPPPDGGRFLRAIDHLRWPFEQREVMQMVDNLKRYSQTFQFAFTIEGFNLLSRSSEDATKGLQEMLQVSKKISELSAQMGLSTEESSKRAAQLEHIIALVPMLAQTAADVNEISRAARLAELREQERRTTDILDWLAPVSSLHKHRDLQVRRAKDTGRWFFEHRDFVEWIDDGSTSHDLLCVGGPGAGKSILSSHIVDFLRTRFKDQDVAVAYYYYDYSEQLSQHPSAFARSLLRQLSSHGENVPSAVAEFYQQTRNAVKDQTWFHDLLAVTRRVVATFTRCFIIIDALDEADSQSQRSGFFEVIGAIRSSSGSTVKLLATTRPHAFNLLDKFHDPVTIEIVADAGDLRRYLAQTIDEHPDSEDLMDNELRRQVLDTLTKTANGLFLLPALQVKTILDQITKADVKRTLLHLSTDLTHAFQSTIQRISNLSVARRDLAFRILMWLSHARRPLTLLELQHAMALRLEDTDLDQDNFPSVRTLVDCCCGLVEVDHESSLIRLVHHSLEEYLRNHDHGLFQDADLVITRTCIKYLMLDSIKDLPYKKREGFAKALDDFAFLEYAALEWGRHAYQVPAEKIKDIALSLLSDSLRMFTMARVRDFRAYDLRNWKEKTWAWAYSGGAGISIAAQFGLSGLLKVLIAQNQSSLCLNARGAYGNTALHEAALSGHEEAAQVLLQHGGSVLDVNHGQSTPLYLAVSYRQLSMVKLLLQYGREQLDYPGPKGFTPLHKAVEQGDEEMVTTLLQAGALVAATNSQGTTPLHVAALRGYLPIAKLLVLSGALVQVKDREGLCPLDSAATGGFTDMVAYFVENGGNIFHRGRELWTPLHRAARRGHTEIVRFFLQRGVNALTSDFKSNTPLHLAVRSGSMAAVKTLVEYSSDSELKRAQLFSRDKKGSTPREVAFFTAHYDIHKYLRAAEREAQGMTEPSSSNILTTGIERGDLQAVQALLAQDPDSINSLDEDGQPPLHVAVQENQKSIIEYLLSRGASIETVGYHGWRALHIAASLGDVDLVELCLAHGAKIDTRTHTNQTPLHKAASSRSVAVVRRILSAGANPEAKNDHGMTALHIAANQNDIDIVRMLVVEYGVDVLAGDRLKLTAAMWAERSGHLDVWAYLRGEEGKVKARKRSVVALQEEAGEELRSRSAEYPSTKELVDALGEVQV
ncbi:ankyrin [Cladophialophora carrionii]|uniref:Ankyrin n=1 Tax=Cladophialophora carrionii TaxID=86049 RepID=A0A1C1CLF2_9EURO|nr:ankyrin [Cladophialophora carrionii]